MEPHRIQETSRRANRGQITKVWVFLGAVWFSLEGNEQPSLMGFRKGSASCRFKIMKAVHAN